MILKNALPSKKRLIFYHLKVSLNPLEPHYFYISLKQLLNQIWTSHIWKSISLPKNKPHEVD